MSTSDSIVTYKTVPGFPGYKVGSDGSVWSQWMYIRYADGSSCYKRGKKYRRLKASWKGKTGKRNRYLTVTLRTDRLRKQLFVHTLVATAFHGPRPAGLQCRHLDDDPRNNAARNIKWGTSKENHADMVRLGRKRRGEQTAASKLTDKKVIQVCRLRFDRGWTLKRIAAKFHVSRPTIASICSGETWTHVTKPILDDYSKVPAGDG